MALALHPSQICMATTLVLLMTNFKMYQGWKIVKMLMLIQRFTNINYCP